MTVFPQERRLETIAGWLINDPKKELRMQARAASYFLAGIVRSLYSLSRTRQMESVQINRLKRIRWRVSYNISVNPLSWALKSRQVREGCLCVPLLSVAWSDIAAGAFGYPVHPIRAPIPCVLNDAGENSAAIWWGVSTSFSLGRVSERETERGGVEMRSATVRANSPQPPTTPSPPFDYDMVWNNTTTMIGSFMVYL